MDWHTDMSYGARYAIPNMNVPMTQLDNAATCSRRVCWPNTFRTSIDLYETVKPFPLHIRHPVRRIHGSVLAKLSRAVGNMASAIALGTMPRQWYFAY